MCCLKSGVCKSFTDLKSILFPLSLSGFAGCLFLWCMEMHVLKSNALQRRICLSWPPSFPFLLPHKKICQDSVNPEPTLEVFYCAWLCFLQLGEQTFYCYHVGWMERVELMWDQNLGWWLCRVDPRSTSAPGLQPLWRVIFWLCHSRDGVLTSCDYLSLALSPCQ